MFVHNYMATAAVRKMPKGEEGYPMMSGRTDGG